MRFRTDDDLRAVTTVFLGPPRFTTPWRARGQAYALWGLAFIVLSSLRQRAGIPVTPISMTWVGILAVGVATAVGKLVSPLRPAWTLVLTFWREVTAPRPPRPATSAWDERRMRVRVR